MSSDVIYASLMAAGSAILGATITGVATVKMARIGFNERRTKALTRMVLRDLEFFVALEQEYLARLNEQHGGSAQSVKFSARDAVKSRLGRSPSQRTEPSRLQKLIQAAEKDL